MNILIGIYLALILNSFLNAQSSFDYLKINDHHIQTTHQLKYNLEINKSYKLLDTTNYQPTFDGKQFNVSLAAYAKDEDFIMIHAETHTDGSGGLDYSKLKTEKFNEINFNSREQCAEFNEAIIDEEHDLKFLKDNSFNPLPAIFIKQYLTTSPDGKAEVVISYGKRVANCQPEVITEKLTSEIIRKAEETVKILK